MTVREHHIVVRRHARYFVAGDLATARDVWIVVHGYGQLAADFLASCSQIATGERALVAPEALNRFYRERAGEGTHTTTPVGATWMTREDREAEIADYVGYLDAVAAEVTGAGGRLTVLGFSQGVATVTRWVALGAARVDRVILWAGSLPDDLDIAAHAGRFPGALDVVVGSRDKYASWADVETQRLRLEAAGLSPRVHGFDGGHRLDRQTLLTLAGA